MLHRAGLRCWLLYSFFHFPWKCRRTEPGLSRSVSDLFDVPVSRVYRGSSRSSCSSARVVLLQWNLMSATNAPRRGGNANASAEPRPESEPSLQPVSTGQRVNKSRIQKNHICRTAFKQSCPAGALNNADLIHILG